MKINSREELHVELDEEIFDALLEIEKILIPTHFVFEVKRGMRVIRMSVKTALLAQNGRVDQIVRKLEGHMAFFAVKAGNQVTLWKVNVNHLVAGSFDEGSFCFEKKRWGSGGMFWVG